MDRDNEIIRFIRKVPLAQHTFKFIVGIINNYYQQQKVAMFHMGRCGSSVLAKMLDSHSKVYWAGEIFEKIKNEGRNNEFIANRIEFKRNSKISRIFGFETKFLPHQHLSARWLNTDLEEYIHELCNSNFTKFIILTRKNYLKWMASALVAAKTQRWHTNNSINTPEKITLNLDSPLPEFNNWSLLEWFQNIDNSINDLIKYLSKKELLTINYEEDILNDPSLAYKKICRFLDINNESPNIEFRKTNPFPLDKVIQNFSDISSALINTKYHWMIDK